MMIKTIFSQNLINGNNYWQENKCMQPALLQCAGVAYVIKEYKIGVHI